MANVDHSYRLAHADPCLWVTNAGANRSFASSCTDRITFFCSVDCGTARPELFLLEDTRTVTSLPIRKLSY